jgi:hypothetical protein
VGSVPDADADADVDADALVVDGLALSPGALPLGALGTLGVVGDDASGAWP